MRAGELNRLIDLLRYTVTKDSNTFEDIETETTLATKVPAKVTFRSGNEAYLRGVNIQSQVLLIQTRYRTDVKVTDLVKYDGERFQIDFIKPLGNRKGLEFTCTVAP